MGIVHSLFGVGVPSLRPRCPASFAQPPERDRQALYWWLKRNTSYTAVKHNAALWDTFAIAFEEWLRAQDEPSQEDIATYKYIVDSQLSYERGLDRLLRGDRSVWRRQSSEGWLEKVNTGLVAQRMELYGPPDDYFERFGIPVTLIRAYKKAHEAAIIVGHSISYFSLDNAPHRPARSLLALLPFETTVPEPEWSVSFKPGQRAPRDGIYEQVNSDGHIVSGMQYFVKGELAAEDDVLEFGPDAGIDGAHRTNAFHWRLLWEDSRYKDGTIPDEERFYPTPSESLVPPSAQVPQSLRCEAGEACPREGWWFTPAGESRVHFKQGEVMPDVKSDYGQTIWQWSGE